MSKMAFTLLVFCVSLASVMAQNSTASTSSPRPKIHDIVFREDSEQECSMRFIIFQSAYLRGVKSPNLISFNDSSYEDCHMKCCYETSFECRSFSYFLPLRQCFIMNLTRFDSRVELIDVKGYIHVQRMPDIEPTTSVMETTSVTDDGTTASLYDEDDDDDEEVTTQEEATTEADSWDNIKVVTDSEHPDNETDGSGMEESDVDEGAETNAPEKSPDRGVLEEPDSPEKIVSTECPLTCENKGRCELRPKSGDEGGQEAFCACEEGLSGEKCETVVTEEDGFPVWIIVIVVIGSLIIIFIIVCCVLLQVYKRKKGEYSVVEWARRWARRGRKPKKADNPDELAHVEEGTAEVTSPTTSVQSIQNSNASSSPIVAV